MRVAGETFGVTRRRAGGELVGSAPIGVARLERGAQRGGVVGGVVQPRAGEGGAERHELRPTRPECDALEAVGAAARAGWLRLLGRRQDDRRDY